MRIKSHIPNVLTSCNLLSGCLSVVSSFNGNPDSAFYWILAGLAFDFADGFVARLLSVSSSIGKELDSLADCITFGLAPACFLIPPLKSSLFVAHFPFIIYFPFIITVFSAIRLAKFNIDTRQSDSFIGLPTPANALFCFSLPEVFEKIAQYVKVDFAWVIPILIFQSYLMNAELPLLALKFKHFSWKGNEIRYGLIFISIVSILLAGKMAIPVIILAYVLLSVISSLRTAK